MEKQPTDQQPLAQEVATFEGMRSELLKQHPGKFVLIKVDRLIGSFDDFETAHAEGVKRFGTEPFLVKQALEKDPEHQVPALTLGLLRAHS